VLDRITHADDLGVYMDPKLKFSDHISTMVLLLSKGGRRNSMIPKDLVYFISPTNS